MATSGFVSDNGIEVYKNSVATNESICFDAEVSAGVPALSTDVEAGRYVELGANGLYGITNAPGPDAASLDNCGPVRDCDCILVTFPGLTGLVKVVSSTAFYVGEIVYVSGATPNEVYGTDDSVTSPTAIGWAINSGAAGGVIKVGLKPQGVVL